jgi:hypothetical protein
MPGGLLWVDYAPVKERKGVDDDDDDDDDASQIKINIPDLSKEKIPRTFLFKTSYILNPQ